VLSDTGSSVPKIEEKDSPLMPPLRMLAGGRRILSGGRMSQFARPAFSFFPLLGVSGIISD